MSKEFKIGLLGLVASVMLYTGFSFLKGTDFFSSTHRYYAIYQDINGLTVSNAVMLNGLSVGRVSSITILQKEGNKLLVSLDVRKDVILGNNTQASLGDAGLLGGKLITLNIGKIEKVLKNGDTLKAQTAEGMVAALSKKADPLVAKADSIMGNVNEILKELNQSKKALSQTLNNANEISGSLKNTLSRGEIDQILRNVNTLSASLLTMQKQFQPIITKADNIADKFNKLELEKAVQQANESMANVNQILTKVNKGEGTLGKLTANDSLYNNFNNVSHNLDRLFLDLRENPKRYVNISVFGKKDKEKKK